MKYRSSKKIFSFLYFSIGSLIAAIFVGLFLLYCVYMLPTARMRYNVNRSLTYIQAENDSYMWAPYQKSSALDGFTDSIMLGNAIYESKFSALHDALVNPRMEFTPGDTVPVDSLAKYASGETGGKEVTYARYWHGYLVLLKPLLLIFSPADIRLLNMTAQFFLGLFALLLAYKKAGYRLAIPFASAMLCLNPISTALCFQYTDVYLLTLIFEVILLHFRTDQKTFGYLLFLWLGILVAYFDFLTYPLVSLGFLLITELLLCQETLPRKLQRFLRNSASWVIGYGGMWASKWILATLFTEQNVIRDALSSAQERTSCSVNSSNISPLFVLKRNIQVYINPSVGFLLLLLCIGLLYLLIVKNRRLRFRASSIVSFSLCAILPVIWTFLLTNHSIIHPYMTYRNFAVSAMAMGCIIADCFRQEPRQP